MSRRCPVGVPKPNNGGLFRLFCTASSFINPATVSHLSRLCGPHFGPQNGTAGKTVDRRGPQKMPAVTSKTVHTLPDGEYLISDNLYLRVRGTSRSFIFRYISPAKKSRRKISLGSARKITIADARDEAARCRLLLSKGIDPLVARDTLKAPQPEESTELTFGDFWERALEEYVKVRRIKEKTAATYAGQVRNHILPALGAIKLSEITPAICADAILPIWTERPTTGVNVRMILEQIFTVAMRDGIVSSNPALWRGNLSLFLPPLAKIHTVTHRPAPSIDELRDALPKMVRARGTGPIAGAFTILTACRLSEALLSKWQEISSDRRTFTIPPERRKDGKPYPHRVPLSQQAQIILQAIESPRNLIFESRYCKGTAVTKAAVLMALRTATKSDSLTMHGCRSTFSSWCAEQGVNPEVREACLMHVVGTASSQAYQRSDLLEQRREVMQRWADAILPMETLESALAERR